MAKTKAGPKPPRGEGSKADMAQDAAQRRRTGQTQGQVERSKEDMQADRARGAKSGMGGGMKKCPGCGKMTSAAKCPNCGKKM